MSNGSNINPNFVINLWFKYYVLLFLWLIAHPFSDFKCASLGTNKHLNSRMNIHKMCKGLTFKVQSYQKSCWLERCKICNKFSVLPQR